MVDVSLGTSKTISDMTIGSSGGTNLDGVPSIGGSAYNTTADRATAAVLSGSGIGTDTKWATIGVPFTVTGSGSQSATVAAVGDYNTSRTVLGASSASINIEFYLKNVTTGTSLKTSIFSANSSAAGFTNNAKSFNQGLSATLRGGDKYKAYIYLETSISIAGIGEACADAGPQDGDDYSPKQGVVLKDVKVTF